MTRVAGDLILLPEAGTMAGTMAGTEAGAVAGTEAGAVAGTEAKTMDERDTGELI
jgi:hypothetical protein